MKRSGHSALDSSVFCLSWTVIVSTFLILSSINKRLLPGEDCLRLQSSQQGHSYHHTMTVIRLTKINSLGLESEDNILLKTYICIICILSLLRQYCQDYWMKLFQNTNMRWHIIKHFSTFIKINLLIGVERTTNNVPWKSLLFVDNGKWSQRRNWLCTW